MEEANASVRKNLFFRQSFMNFISGAGNADGSRMHTNLIRLGLHLENMRPELVVALYPSLLFEESTFFFSEIIQTLVQGLVQGQLN
jgi:hypothetical protein